MDGITSGVLIAEFQAIKDGHRGRETTATGEDDSSTEVPAQAQCIYQ